MNDRGLRTGSFRVMTRRPAEAVGLCSSRITILWQWISVRCRSHRGETPGDFAMILPDGPRRTASRLLLATGVIDGSVDLPEQ
jgi:hypothetical protein